MKPDIDKVEIIRDMPESRTVREVMEYTGVEIYILQEIYNCVFKDYYLTINLTMYVMFKWTNVC